MVKSRAKLILVLLTIVHTCCYGSWECNNTNEGGSGSSADDLSLTTEGRCVPYEEAVGRIIFSDCVPFISENKCQFFDYGADFTELQDTLQRLSNYVQMLSISNYCEEVVMSYMCNYVYPGCNTSREVPVGICTEECSKFVTQGECMETFENLESATTLVDMFHIDITCQNGSQSSRFLNYTTDPFECFNISGSIQATVETPPETDSLPLEWIIPVATVGPVAIIAFILLLLLCVIIVCRRRTKKKKRRQSPFRPSSLHMNYFQSSSPTAAVNPFQVTCYMRENSSNDYLLREVVPPESVKSGDRNDELPLFQLLSEDVDRLGNSLRDILVPFRQLCFTDEIAQGAFGRVYRGVYTESGDSHGTQTEGGDLIQVAIKTIKETQVQDSYKNIRDFIEESALMHSFDHPNVLGLIGISLDKNSSPYIILPYMENGDLRTFLKNKREVATKSTDTGYPEGLQYDMLVRICHEVAGGMEYLASRKLVHRDLAARNCMVDRNVSIKVADFGLTRDIYETDYYIQRFNAKVPVKWMSPESLHDRISNEATDVWAYGVTCWEVFSLGRTPYPTVTNHEMLEYLEQGRRLKRPALCSDEMGDLMKRCWVQHPGDRPLFTEIVEMFNGYIIPESCTPTIGNARYKVNIKAGSNEESLLDTIVNQLQHSRAESFENIIDAVSKTDEPTLTGGEMPQESYISLGNSYYVKMNPILENIASQTNFGSYPYEIMVRGVPQTEQGVWTSRERLMESGSIAGNSLRWN